ncbi:MAG: methyltransferase domain-containing protein [Proteobacteria bacterium]|nr:methyltransferase domain-containing protein [Pseudomonadota bacterium]
MWPHVVDLRDFYASSLGQVARRMIRRQLRLLWPNVAGERVLGLGYATPYLRAFRDEAERVLAFMPASLGVLHWPPDEPCLTALVVEDELPLPDLSIDRVLMVHALECGEDVRSLMREAWRVLADSGRLLLVVPNRRGLWARFEHTPFGFGRPYSPAQVTRMLRDTLFTPERSATALYMPPLPWPMMLRAAGAWENIGGRWFTTLGGVILIEARKQIYAGARAEERVRARRRIYAPLPRRLHMPEPRAGPGG